MNKWQELHKKLKKNQTYTTLKRAYALDQRSKVLDKLGWFVEFGYTFHLICQGNWIAGISSLKILQTHF